MLQTVRSVYPEKMVVVTNLPLFAQLPIQNIMWVFFKDYMGILSLLWVLYCEYVFILFVLKATSLSGKRALNLRQAWVEMSVRPWTIYPPSLFPHL